MHENTEPACWRSDEISVPLIVDTSRQRAKQRGRSLSHLSSQMVCCDIIFSHLSVSACDTGCVKPCGSFVLARLVLKKQPAGPVEILV